MKDADQVVERVLVALSEAEVPDGMEARVLRRVRERAMAERSPARVPWAWVRRSAVAAVMAAVAAVWLVGLHEPLRSRPVSTRVAAAPSFGDAGGRQSGVVGVFLKAGPVRRPLSREGARTQRQKKDGLDGAGNGPVAMMSYPAPPLPLTEQERLLLLVVHRGDRAQEAMLRVGEGTPWGAEGKAEFDRFFAGQPKEEVDANQLR